MTEEIDIRECARMAAEIEPNPKPGTEVSLQCVQGIVVMTFINGLWLPSEVPRIQDKTPTPKGTPKRVETVEQVEELIRRMR